ncbi:MAG TPA: class I SAM-dependent methyltransferase [Pyrinomonadaceae bacterium]|nr:class I SAM-dependent methyltransferase [Pyrinomonadaceae bacterium]
MSTSTDIIRNPLPREMQQHMYAIMRRVEENHWWYRGRRKIIRSFVEAISRAKSGSLNPNSKSVFEVLDVGCGTGANLEMLSEFSVPAGVDISAEAVSYCHARGFPHVKNGAAETLPFDADSFDLVTALDVVEHLDDDVATLKEMRRVVKPDGRILLFVPAFMFLWGVQDDVSNHRRRYTIAEIKRAVVEAGFEVERASYVNISFFFPTLLGRLIMRVTGIRPASEANINIEALNGVLGSILGAESALLRHMNLPFGVSIVCVARKVGS